MSGTYTRSAPATRGHNAMAIAGLVCGVIGLVVFNVILGPLAVIFGGVGLHSANRGAGRRGMARVDIVLGIIDMVLFVLAIAVASKHSFNWSWHAG
jgi:hypothetical protein